MWVMLGEMFPNQIRGSALAVSRLRPVVRELPDLVQLPGRWRRSSGLTVSYTFYGVCAVISFFLVQKLIHETRGKELEQMEG